MPRIAATVVYRMQHLLRKGEGRGGREGGAKGEEERGNRKRAGAHCRKSGAASAVPEPVRLVEAWVGKAETLMSRYYSLLSRVQ